MNEIIAAPAIIETSIEVFRQGPEILKTNQEKTSKALAVGRSILQQWQDAWTIEDEEEKIKALAAADERSNKYLANCSTALKMEKESRAVVTQIMDELKKLFTACENEIDNTKANTIPSKVQNWRDQYAKTLYEINERKRKEAEHAAAKAKEAVELKSTIIVRLSNYFNDFLHLKKSKLQEGFNNMVLDGFADKAADLRQYDPVYSEKHFSAFNPNVYSSLHSKEELDLIIQEAVGGKFTDYSQIYKEQMLLLKQELVDKLPSKHAELKEQARIEREAKEAAERARVEEEERQRQIKLSKDNAEKERLKKEAEEAQQREKDRLENLRIQQENVEMNRKRREEEEAARLQKEAEDAKKKAELDAEMTKQADQTMIMFDQEAALAENTAAPEARQGYDIIATHQAAYVQIFQMWFENEGKNLSLDKMEKTSLGQMKAFCEKFAHKNNTKIESKFLRYEESFRAINKKAK